LVVGSNPTGPIYYKIKPVLKGYKLGWLSLFYLVSYSLSNGFGDEELEVVFITEE
jgi:hypothetical protein